MDKYSKKPLIESECGNGSFELSPQGEHLESQSSLSRDIVATCHEMLTKSPTVTLPVRCLGQVGEESELSIPVLFLDQSSDRTMVPFYGTIDDASLEASSSIVRSDEVASSLDATMKTAFFEGSLLFERTLRSSIPLTRRSLAAEVTVNPVTTTLLPAVLAVNLVLTATLLPVTATNLVVNAPHDANDAVNLVVNALHDDVVANLPVSDEVHPVEVTVALVVATVLVLVMTAAASLSMAAAAVVVVMATLVVAVFVPLCWKPRQRLPVIETDRAREDPLENLGEVFTKRI